MKTTDSAHSNHVNRSYLNRIQLRQPSLRKFLGKLKQEWPVQYGPFENIEQVRLALFEYIEGYYYTKRLHQALGYRTPRDVEEEFLQNH